MTGSGLTGSEYIHGIEVKKVYYEPKFPASARYLDPYNGFGLGLAGVKTSTGLGQRNHSFTFVSARNASSSKGAALSA